MDIPRKQRVTMSDRIRSHRALAKTNHDAGARYQAFWMEQRLRRNTRVGWWDLCTPLPNTNARALVAAPFSHPTITSATDNVDLRQPEIYDAPMSKPCLPPVFPSGSLNLNPDGSTITYRKSHLRLNATNWEQADAEEMERLFTSGTLRPIMPDDIPEDEKPTYVNSVCSEKLKDNDKASEHHSASLILASIIQPRSALRASFSLAQPALRASFMFNNDMYIDRDLDSHHHSIRLGSCYSLARLDSTNVISLDPTRLLLFTRRDSDHAICSTQLHSAHGIRSSPLVSCYSLD